jgi:hypothetical protein
MTSRLSHVVVAALQSSAQITAAVSLLAGAISHHLVFRPFEIDGYAWQLFFTHLITFFVLIIGNVYVAGYGVILALARALLIETAYNTGVVTSILVYRAFFHPLQRFPGPFMAKISRFYAMNNAAKQVQAYKDIQNLHKQYGDVVRVGASSSHVFAKFTTKSIVKTPISKCRTCFNIHCRPPRTIHQPAVCYQGHLRTPHTNNKIALVCTGVE